MSPESKIDTAPPQSNHEQLEGVPDYIAGPLVLGGLRIALRLGAARESRLTDEVEAASRKKDDLQAQLAPEKPSAQWKPPDLSNAPQVTRKQRRLKKKIDNLTHKKMRGAMVHDLAHLRNDIQRPSSKLPDRRPEIGDKDTRSKVDDLLIRRGLLPGSPITAPKPIEPGTSAYNPTVRGGHTHQGRSEVARSTRHANKYSGRIAKNNKKIDKLSSKLLGTPRKPSQKDVQKKINQVDSQVTSSKSRLQKRQLNNSELSQIYAALDNDYDREDRQDARHKRYMQKRYGRVINQINDRANAFETKLRNEEGRKALGGKVIRLIQVAEIKAKKRATRKKSK